MRIPATLACAVLVLGGAALIGMAGSALLPADPAEASTTPQGPEQAGIEDVPVVDPAAPAGPSSNRDVLRPVNTLHLDSEPESYPEPQGSVRSVAPDIVAPPEYDPAELERETARDPLSQLSLALPPKPREDAEWPGTILYRPTVTASARFEAMGFDVSIAGVESIGPDETCLHDGRAWPCGMRARTAFRYWLRGRAPICALPDDPGAMPVARCRLGKQDAGAWLVSHGWARAAPDGPYADAEKQARDKKLGIFGNPPRAIE